MKKAKKFLVGLLAWASVSAFAFGFSGCNDKKTNVGTGNFPSGGLGGLGGGGGATHTHTYDQEVVDGKYAQTAADCLNGGVYYKSCECGAKGTETFSAPALGHTGDFCTRCNQSVASEGLVYKLANDGASYIVIDIGDCTDSNLYIPNEHESLPVSGIGDKAFDYCSTLTSVTIPDSVTTIGNEAFYKCDNLTDVTIGNSVTTIGNEAFAGDSWDGSSLTSVTIGNSVTTIGFKAFSYCYNLTSVYYTGDVAGWCAIEFDGSSANPLSNSSDFYRDHEKADLYVNNKKVVDLVIPDGAEKINDYAFYACDNLTSITISDSVTAIGEYAFYDCDGLTSVTIGNSVTTIGDCAFYSCEDLKRVAIPDSVTTIGDCAFAYCDKLTEAVIGNSVTAIGDGAFAYCPILISVTIGNSVTTIGDKAFYACENLTSVVFEDTSTWYRTSNKEDWQNKVNGNQVDVSDEEDAADLLTNFRDNNYHFWNYYWYKL